MTRLLFPLIAGILGAGYAVAALFFLRFWRTTRDRLFALFALAFALLAVERVADVVARATVKIDAELPFWVYLLRLAAFLLIVVAIVQKNLGESADGT
jgi:hypothetical protein